MNNLSNPMNPQINILNNSQGNQPAQTNSNGTTEIQEFFNYLNSQNNMNLKKIILFYSKYSKLCEQFINSLHPNYKLILNMISVDNSLVRKRLMNSKYKLQYVPCIFMLFENGNVNVHYGNELLSLVTFFNKNMEAFMVIKTNENLAKRKNTLQPGQGITPLITGKNQQMNLDNNMDEIVHNSNGGNITSLNLQQGLGDKISQQGLATRNSQQKKLKMKNIPRIKEPIPEDFKRDMNIGISSKRMVPKGRKEHKKMARSSLTVLESNRQLDTIEEEDEDTTDDDEEDTNIEMEDAEILDNILEEQEDNTIDPIISSKTKKDIKDIAAEMAKERGPIDDKPVIH